MILERLSAIRGRIADAAKRSGRPDRPVEMIAVVKKAPIDDLRLLLREGTLSFLGENRIQDAAKRREALGPEGAGKPWRFIGRLQTNKAKQAVSLFDWVDSVDGVELAEALDARAAQAGKRLKVLLQVKLSDRETQGGTTPGELEALLGRVRSLPHLEPRGLMAIAPMLEPVEGLRPHFRLMRTLLDRHFAPESEPVLSMGMSRDFELAVEEGATLVRIGSALFDP
ncbi:MAG: YggS family pyridoxal phosphate-dependent enzyme [Elusimicrobiota bacterium]